MPEMNRRAFVAAASAAAAAICLSVLEVDPAHATPSARGGGGMIDVGPLSDYPTNIVSDKFAKAQKLFVVRSGDQIYAMSANCTHKHCLLGLRDNNIKCHCHGSMFSEHGTVTSGPAKYSLPRYAIKLNEQKHLIVDKSREFAERQWDDAACFVKVS